MELDVHAAPGRENGVVEHPSADRARSAFPLLAKRSQQVESLAVNASIKLGAEVLAAFSSLKRLKITDNSPNCQLDDNGVELLCRSLRNLRTFHLSYYRHYEDTTGCAKITPKSLGSFSRHCQDLTDLGLPITATKPEDFVGPVLTEMVAFRESLRQLEFAPLVLPADRATDFVSFLIVQCPKLTRLDMYRLEITDPEISRSTARDMSKEMEAAFFQAQRAL